ncbi:hypothetical protein Pst134EA_017983 [Puccinia striiformis f. sp. tritici]|uniref:hypothetical protein n=1 Tax=Puccinia striiformis f. sp. tritici TaxID=168172 RepID=UPI002007E79C|nr:hypothetical protein Pst134EA_017983 [Puccinia striiformis f. sp. tritici]KAH9461697.1 hypothetical protein Pst134EA_017983 [Puccinia striiformis f. sp. tritici]
MVDLVMEWFDKPADRISKLFDHVEQRSSHQEANHLVVASMFGSVVFRRQRSHDAMVINI